MTKCLSKWVVRAGGETSPEVAVLPPHLYVLMLKIEAHCRNRVWCWAGNDTLAKQLGRSERSVQRGLEQIEDRGIIARVMSDRERPERMGIVLLKRIDPSRPYCRTNRQLQELAYTIRDRWQEVTGAKGEVNPVVLAGDPDFAKPGFEETPENPGKKHASARHERRAQHDTDDVPSTTRMTSEEEGLNKTEEQQQKLPALKVVEAPELTQEQATAVEGIRKAVEGSGRPEAAQGVADVAARAIVKGHGPGRVSALAREAIKPGINNPAGWLRRAIEARAGDEGGLLKDRPKPPPPPSAATIKINPEDAAFYEAAIKAKKTGIGVGRRKFAYAGRAN